VAGVAVEFAWEDGGAEVGDVLSVEPGRQFVSEGMVRRKAVRGDHVLVERADDDEEVVAS
jgi:hypothetical protein